MDDATEAVDDQLHPLQQLASHTEVVQQQQQRLRLKEARRLLPDFVGGCPRHLLAGQEAGPHLPGTALDCGCSAGASHICPQTAPTVGGDTQQQPPQTPTAPPGPYQQQNTQPPNPQTTVQRQSPAVTVDVEAGESAVIGPPAQQMIPRKSIQGRTPENHLTFSPPPDKPRSSRSVSLRGLTGKKTFRLSLWGPRPRMEAAAAAGILCRPMSKLRPAEPRRQS